MVSLGGIFDLQLLVAFLSGFLLVPAYIAKNAVMAIFDHESKSAQKILLPDYLFNWVWWIGMVILGILNAFIIYYHISKGAVFTTSLTIQVCLATTFAMKKAGELSNLFAGDDVG